MANPASCGTTKGDYKPCVVVTDNSEVAVTLDPDKTYTLLHSGLDGTSAGSSDTSMVYLSFNETVATAVTAGSANKGLLPSLTEITIGPGLKEVSFLTAGASNEPAVTIVPHTTTFGHH